MNVIAFAGGDADAAINKESKLKTKDRYARAVSVRTYLASMDLFLQALARRSLLQFCTYVQYVRY